MTTFRIFLMLTFALLPASILAANPESGKALFQSKGCTACHQLGAEGPKKPGPNLAGVTKIRKHEWIHQHIMDPASLKDDPIVQSDKGKYKVTMPKVGLTDREVEDIIAYLETVPAKP